MFEMMLVSLLCFEVIVFGKYLVLLVYVSIFVFVFLLIVMFCLLLGGEFFLEVLVVYVVFFVFVIMFGMISIVCSSFF